MSERAETAINPPRDLTPAEEKVGSILYSVERYGVADERFVSRELPPLYRQLTRFLCASPRARSALIKALQAFGTTQ